MKQLYLIYCKLLCTAIENCGKETTKDAFDENVAREATNELLLFRLAKVVEEAAIAICAKLLHLTMKRREGCKI